MPTIEELQAVLQKQEFLSLPTEVKTQFVNESLTSLLGESYAALAPDKQQRVVEFAMSEARPRGFVESALQTLPIVGPLTQEYVYDREVAASPLVEQMVGPEASRKHGVALQISEDLILTGASLATMGIAAPGLFAARTLGGIALREGVLEGLYEVGKLVTTPPRSAGEAAFRLGAGVAGGAVLGTGLELGIGKIASIIKDRRMENRWHEAFGSTEAADAFTQKIESGDLTNISLDEIARMERVAGSSEAEWAQTLRHQAEGLREAKQTLQGQRFAEQETLAVQAEQAERELAELRTQRMLETTQGMAETRLAQRAQEEAARGVETAELLRQKDVNAHFAQFLPAEGQPLTRSEAMLSDLLRNPAIGNDGFVGTEPITLPIGMMHDTPNGTVPVIVEKFNAEQATLWGGKAVVPRTALRTPRTADEARMLNDILEKNGVGGIPTRDESLGIMQQRVTAEQLVRRADNHSTRPDFLTNASAQEQAFALRREAADRLLQATNKEFSLSTTSTASGAKAYCRKSHCCFARRYSDARSQ